MKEQLIFVIADTHNKLPPLVAELGRGANEIWHLGDICNETVLDQLKLLGPAVTVVRGNCDSNSNWPLMAELTRNGTHFRLQHIPPSPRQSVPHCDVLLHGHTHVPRDETVGGVRFLNPGCVTRPNRGSPASAAFLKVQSGGNITWELRLLR